MSDFGTIKGFLRKSQNDEEIPQDISNSTSSQTKTRSTNGDPFLAIQVAGSLRWGFAKSCLRPPNLNKADVRLIRSRYALFPVISKIDHLEILEAF